MTSLLTAKELRLGYHRRRPVVDGLSVRFEPGTVTTLIGPNGCGKSTLLKALGRLLTPQAGSVALNGVDLAELPTRQIARELAILPQSPIAPAGITVADLVMRGRNPHQTVLRQWSARDSAVVAETLRQTGLADLADQPVDELSGGQRQRAWVALVLAQQAELLLLDEPTTYLDLTHQLEVLNLIRRLNREQRKTIVMVLHDLNLAARYSDRLLVMVQGRIVADGPPATVLTPDLLRTAFGLTAAVISDPLTGGPLVVPADEWGALSVSRREPLVKVRLG